MSETIKIVLLGETSVGKTSIISRFASNSFNPNTLSSLSAQFVSKTVEIDGKSLKLDLWDTAGQEKYRALAKIFYKDARVIIFVYDITNEKTFEEIKNYWYNETKENVEEDVIYCLVGNKNDLYEEEKVSEKEAQEYADQINAIFKSTSALSNTGIPNLFDNVVRKILNPNFDYKAADKKLAEEFQKKHDEEEKERQKEKNQRIKLSESDFKDNNNNNGNKKKKCCHN
jgi:small GTP-binding protein